MNFDESDLDKLDKVYPDLAERWKRVAKDMFDLTGKVIKVVEGYRSFGDQLQYYKQGRRYEGGDWRIIDKSKIITEARPGSSLHNYGLAIDSAFSGVDPYLDRLKIEEAIKLWDEYGKIVQTHGLIWGGNFKFPVDRPHCEIKYGLSLSKMQIIFQDTGLKGVWKCCSSYLNQMNISKMGV